MDEDKLPKRDNKGDVRFSLSDEDMEKIRKSQYTYIFHYHNDKKDDYIPCFGLYSSADPYMEKVRQDSNFFEKQLYWTPDSPPYDFFIHYHNWQLELLVEFFKEVLEEKAFIKGYMPSHKYSKIILPKGKYQEIMECINKFELLPIRDLLLEVIAIAQHKYVEHIAFWERPEMQKLVNSAEKETRKAIAVIEKLHGKIGLRDDTDEKPPSKLLHINFAFNDRTIKLEHEWLAREFIDLFKKHYDDLPYKDWKKELERYPESFEDNTKNQQFKYKLAKSFYNLLTKTGFFKLTKKVQTPNRLMLCIAKLLEFCLIQVAGPEELDEIKIRKIRNWLNRKELQPTLAYMEIMADKERLLKYFESDLVNIADDIKRADAIAVGLFLAEKYNLDHLKWDLIHIAAALKEYNSHIGHQMIGGSRPFEPKFPEFTAFSKLVNDVRAGRKISSFKYRLEDDETEYELTQRLPAYLIEQAIKEYSDDQQVEFDTEPVQTSITKTEDGRLQINKASVFMQPEDRFMVRLVRTFYDYLLVESPPDESDVMPSERYYSIIADMLQQTWFFYHQRHPDWFVKAKVTQWHELALRE